MGIFFKRSKGKKQKQKQHKSKPSILMFKTEKQHKHFVSQIHEFTRVWGWVESLGAETCARNPLSSFSVSACVYVNVTGCNTDLASAIINMRCQRRAAR